MATPEKNTDAVYDASTLGTPKMLVLGLQHLFAMFGATVLVPAITGLNVSTTLLFAGLGTLLFHLITGRKVPAFLGSSFAFLGAYGLVTASGQDIPLTYSCFGVAVAGLVYLVLALFFKLFGAKKVMRFFPPIVTGPIIICIGLSLAGSAINNCRGNWWVALVAILVVVVCNIWGKGMVKIVPILLGVLGSYLFAMIVDPAARANVAKTVAEADWVGLPVIWGNTAFSIFGKDFDSGMLLTAIITIAPISLATVVEHIGDICAISSTVTSISARRLLMLTWDFPSLRGISAQSFSKCAFTAASLALFPFFDAEESGECRSASAEQEALCAIGDFCAAGNCTILLLDPLQLTDNILQFT